MVQILEDNQNNSIVDMEIETFDLQRLPQSQLPEEEIVGEDIEQPEEEREQNEEPQIQQKKKRCRPKGSKNKAILEKQTKTSNTQQPQIPDFLQNKYRGELRSRKKH